MVKKFVTDFDSSKVSGLVYIPIVILKNCKLQLSYLLANLFNICLKEPCFSDSCNFSFVGPVLTNFGEMFVTENYSPVSLLSVSKIFEQLVNI